MRKITLLILAMILSIPVLNAQCGPGQNIDQNFVNAALTASTREEGNSFIAPCNGFIESVTIRVNNVTPGTATMTVHAGDTGVNPLGSTTFAITGAGDVTATFATPIPVSAGSTYTYMADPGTAFYRLSLGTGEPYPDGENLWNNGGTFFSSTSATSDFRFLIAFVDQVDPVAVCSDFTAQLDILGNVTITGADVDGGSTDDSGSVTLSVSPNTFDCSDIGANTVTLTATDAAGNTDTCTATVTVRDTVAPTITCQDLSVQLDASGSVNIPATILNAGAFDNCMIDTIAFVESTGTAFAEVDENQNLTITAPAGAVITSVDFASYGTPNGSNGSYTIGGCHATNSVAIVEDIALGNNTFTIPATNAVFGDPCFGTFKRLYVTVGYSVLASNMAYTCSDIGANTVTLMALDVNGRSTTCTPTITLEDNTAPNAVCQNITVQLDASGSASITAADVDGGSTDNCGIASMSVSPDTFNCAQEGATIPVTLTVTDVNGNTSTCTANVTVDDIIPPTAVCQDITIQLDASGNASIVPADVDGGSTDNCGFAPLLDVTPNTFDCTNIGPNTVTLRVGDGNGNQSTCTAIVTVQDTMAPVFNTPGGDGSLANPFLTLLPSITGSVPSGTYYFNFNGSTFQGELDNDNAGGGWLMILNYVHQAGDNSALVVRNTDLPLMGASVLGTSEAGSTTWGHFGNALAADIDFEELRFYGQTSRDPNDIIDFTTGYTNAISYVKTGSGSFNGINNAANYTLLGSHTASIPQNAPNEFANQGNFALTNFPFWRGGQAHWGIRGLGNRWEVDDFGVNNFSTIHRVWVRGDLSPDPSIPFTEITVQLDASGSVTVAPADFNITATDNCSTPTYTISQSTFDCSNIGANTIQYTATDAQGNAVSMDVIVNVEDTIAPTLSCPADVVVSNDPGACEANVTVPAPALTDNCFAGTSLNFDGSNDQMIVANGLGGVDMTEMTVEAWINPENISNWDTILNYDSWATGYLHFQIYPSGGLGWSVNGNSPTDQVVTVNFNTNQWYHIAVSYSSTAGTVDFYVDGNLVSSRTYSNAGIVRGDRPYTIGSWNNSRRFDGSMDEIRVWNTARTQAEIQASMNAQLSGSETGLLALYNFEEGTPCADNSGVTTITDRAGGDNNGTLSNFDLSGAGGCQSNFNDSILQSVTLTNDFNGTDDASGVYPIGTTTVTWTATDGSGNVSTCTMDVTVNDTELPVAVCNDITVQLDASGMATVAVSDLDGGSSDNCGFTVSLGASDDISQPTFNTNNNSPGHGQSFTATADGFVETIRFMVNGNSTGRNIHFYNSGTGSGTVDSVATPAYTESGVAFVDSNGGTVWTEVTLTTPFPVVAGNQYSFIFEGFTDIYYAWTNQYPGGEFIWRYDIASGCCAWGDIIFEIDMDESITFDCSNVGPNPVTLTVTDDSGNVSTCTSIVTVEDSIAPTVVCQNIDVILDVAGMATIVAADVDGGSDDICGIADLSIDIDTFDCSNIGPNDVTLTVTDNNGNVSTCIAVVTVIDDEAPVISCPTDVVTDTDAGLCSAIVVFSDALASDNCNVTVAQTAGLPSGSAFPVGVSTVEFTATDDSGNATVCSFTITVEDNEAPIAVCQDITIQLDATGNAAIVAADIDAGSNDACGVDTLAIDMDTFDCSHVGDNTVTLTVTDVNGNTSTCTATVTVEDVTAPEVFCQDITIQLDDNGMATISATDIDNGSTDACGIDTYEVDIDTFDCSMIGDNTVTLTVTDVNGNSTSCTAIVTVEDLIDPVVACMDITVELDENGMAVITPEDVATISDNCGVLTTAIDIFEFSCDDIGTPVTVQIFANDASGNLSSCTAVVTVVDTLAPVITCPADQTVDPGPGMLFYEVPDYFATGEATAIDNCTDPVTITSQDPAAGTLLPDGVYTITLTAEDEYGNVSTCEFELTVESVLGINDSGIDLSTIVMYPNPATELVYLSNPRQIALESAAIYDLTGRLVQTIDLRDMGAEKAIDISLLSTATYAVVISGENGQIIKQLMKE
ncbi:HYR domain-containing protein [Aureisphaera galaxeae]|uniref:HYR domain-containing protein n=1 Tax=Aureisphaera galaxeae TaxID=1538023 RepID=UPI002350AD16|nr:HYR domain-containing protein [Aureisphaera galaxeae]MDC8003313.1 HYR domain-containing protein [Aureisphaera galaxeae]